jgi:hypothetical protein
MFMNLRGMVLRRSVMVTHEINPGKGTLWFSLEKFMPKAFANYAAGVR